MSQMQTEAQIREKPAKIKALFVGASSVGERQAAQVAMDRLPERIDGMPEPVPPVDPPVEYCFSFHNPWSLRLFLALCRSKGFKPYRYPRMRRTSVYVRITAPSIQPLSRPSPRTRSSPACSKRRAWPTSSAPACAGFSPTPELMAARTRYW